MKPMLSDSIQVRIRSLGGQIVCPAIVTRVITPEVDTTQQHAVVDVTAFPSGGAPQSVTSVSLFDVDPGNDVDNTGWWPKRSV
jgi:hypothetical protein